MLPAGTNAGAWAAAAGVPHSALPLWPAIAFGAFALVGLYFVIAPLVPLPPFGRIRSVPELLDDYIRLGRDVRERITVEKLSDKQAADALAVWMLKVANGLHAKFPAIADEFLLVSGDESEFSGQALLIQTLNVKMTILREARKGLGA